MWEEIKTAQGETKGCFIRTIIDSSQVSEKPKCRRCPGLILTAFLTAK